ncbi:MAG: CidA/LrgA family protein [Alistipes sp.]|nr:CidA/LrgA family protein [Alistipes sp.]
MTGIVLILIFWLAGNAVSGMTGNVVSGNVIGMMMLFLALKLRAVNAETVRPAAHFLTANMAVCFVPFGVGLMVSYGAIADNLAAIAVSAAVSTVLVLVCVGRVTQRLYKNR